MITFKLPSARLEVLDGDLAAEDVDAVVNAANNHFWMGAGVAGALKARGGDQIERDAMALGPVEPGACVMTSGGALRARYVIHAAVMGQDLVTSAEIIARATRSSLALAERHAIQSLAFPAFGTGVGGFSIVEAGRTMIAAFRDHEARSVALIRFVAFGQPAYRALAAVAGELLGSALPGPPDCPISG